MILSGRKRIILTIIGFIAVLVVLFIVRQLFFKSPGLDKLLLQEAREKNRTCPFYVDRETRLDNTTVLQGNVFQYNYTLVNRVKDSIRIDDLRRYLEPSILANIRSNPDLRYQRDNNVTISFNYKDKKGVFILKILVTPEMYLK